MDSHQVSTRSTHVHRARARAGQVEHVVADVQAVALRPVLEQDAALLGVVLGRHEVLRMHARALFTRPYLPNASLNHCIQHSYNVLYDPKFPFMTSNYTLEHL